MLKCVQNSVENVYKLIHNLLIWGNLSKTFYENIAYIGYFDKIPHIKEGIFRILLWIKFRQPIIQTISTVKKSINNLEGNIVINISYEPYQK